MRGVRLFIGLVVMINCCLIARPPGQAIASEKNFENGVKQYERGHIKQAIHQFQKAIKKDPTNFKAYFYLGLCYKHEGVIERAIEHFQKSIDLNQNDTAWVAKVKAEMEILPPGKGQGKKKH